MEKSSFPSRITRREFLLGATGVIAGAAVAYGAYSLAAPPSPPVTTPQSVTVTESVTQSVTPYEKIVHVLNGETRPQILPAYDEIKKGFEKEFGCTVIWNDVDWGDIDRKISEYMAAGSAPDLTWGADPVALALEGKAVSLNDVVEAVGPNFFAENYLMGGMLNNNYYALPVAPASASNISYRKDLFEQKGLEVPRTWDELLNTAKVLTEGGRYGIALPYSRQYFVGSLVFNLLIANGGHILNKDKSVAFDSPETYEVMEFLKAIRPFTPPGATEYNWSDLRMAFYTDKVAMSWYPSAGVLGDSIVYAPEIADQCHFMAVPTRTSDQEPIARAYLNGWGMPQGGINPPLAKEFLKYFFREENLKTFFSSMPVYLSPAINSVSQASWYLEHPDLVKYKEAVKEFLALQAYGRMEHMEWPGLMMPETATVAINGLFITDCVQDIVIKNRPVEEAVKEAAQRIADALK